MQWRPVEVGIDLVSPSRVARAQARGVFAMVCHSDEPHQTWSADTAARVWSAKEAVVKTLGPGFWQGGLDFQDIVISTEDWSVNLHRRAFELAQGDKFVIEFREFDGCIMTTALRFKITAQS